MATFHDRTIAPKFQRGLLRAGGVPCRVLTSAEVVAEIEADPRATPCGAWAEVGSFHHGNNPERSTVLHGGARALLPTEPDTAAQARALHSRRALERAAGHGIALLAALNLPQLGRGDITTPDPTAIGDALDTVIAHLDALDAPVEDLEDGGDNEPSLGWTAHGYQTALNIGITSDAELDTADWEPSLGAPENHPGRWHIDMDDTYHVGRARHPLGSQTAWSAGGVQDLELEHDGREHEAGYDLACDEDELDDDGLSEGEHDTADAEGSLGWPNDFTAVLADVATHNVDLEEVNEDGDDCGEAHAPWWDRIGYEVAEGVHA